MTEQQVVWIVVRTVLIMFFTTTLVLGLIDIIVWAVKNRRKKTKENDE